MQSSQLELVFRRIRAYATRCASVEGGAGVASVAVSSHDPSPLRENIADELVDLLLSSFDEGFESGRVVADRLGSALEVAQLVEGAQVGVVGKQEERLVSVCLVVVKECRFANRGVDLGSQKGGGRYCGIGCCKGGGDNRCESCMQRSVNASGLPAGASAAGGHARTAAMRCASPAFLLRLRLPQRAAPTRLGFSAPRSVQS